MASYRQRGKKKLWDYRIFDDKGKVIASNSGFRTKKEAELEAIEIELRLLKGANIDRQISLHELWKKWYELHIIPLNKKQATLNKHIKRGKLIEEFFGNMPLVNIKASRYQLFINQFAKTNGRDNVARLNSEVRKVLEFAKQDRLDFHDFTIGVKITGLEPAKSKEDKYIHSKADYKKLVNYLYNNVNYTDNLIYYLLYIQLKTGMRFGEVLGLTWDCILWKTKEIVTYRRYDSTKNEFTDPKTKTSVRNIPIDDSVIDVLDKLLKEQESLNLKNSKNLLFVDPIYGVPSNKTVNTCLSELLHQLNITPKVLTATGIRHTYISILLAEGIDIWTLSKIVGHKDTKQIIETYSHLIKEKEEEETEKIRKIMSSTN
ncbi:site-specific integrase [Streptococcus suis]|uniref:site-specific integrase n=1 Tax=Streptococcus suis TaxID=1307 RepID=UPI001C9457E7|nr:site-specific integrase [Streptococcus suis]MBY5009662.1 site-specific integrase [Streptococcus suis]MDG4517836.1 site-specific integrase [Streptococcus suis]